MTEKDRFGRGEMIPVAVRPQTSTEHSHTLCPGCGETIAVRLIAEAIDNLGARERAVCVVGVGCYTQATILLRIDFQMALHGRAPAQAAGIKRVLPQNLVFTIQGDGDLIAEGLLEGVHAAARGEKITVFCFNNTLSADTGSHATATTLVGQRTKSTVQGRDKDTAGSPLLFPEMIAGIEGAAYVARVAVHSPAAVVRAQKAIQRALEVQEKGLGFSLVEILTMCPTGWFVDPLQAIDYIEERVVPVFPLGVLKDVPSP